MKIKESLPMQNDRSHLERIFAFSAWLFGVLVLVRIALIISTIKQFAWQIAHLPFPWAVRHSLGIAWTLSALICALALICLFTIRIRLVLVMLIALLVTMSGVAYFADSCDCSDGLRPRFFEWTQRITPALAVYACALLLAGRRSPLLTRGWIKRGVAGLMISTALFVITLFVSGNKLAPMTAVPSSGVELHIYLSATCPHCLKSAPRVRKLEDDPTMSDVVVFIGANSQSEIDLYFAHANLQFEYVALTLGQLREVATAVPASELIAGGKAVAQWHDKIPSPEEVRSELSKSGYSAAVRK